MIREYEDFYLIIDGQKGRYTVAAQGPQQISIKPVPFVYELMDNLEEVLQAIEQGYAPAHDAMGQIGTTLFKALMPEPIRIAFYRAQATLPPAYSLRLRLNIRPAELARLPWELLANEQAYLTIQRATPIVRFLDNPHPVASLKVDGPLRVLHVQASPLNLAPLDLTAGADILQEALGAQAEIVRLPEATPEQLRIALASQSFHILHFDGHGEFDAFHNQGMLMLMNERKRAYALSSTQLAAYLSGTDIRFVMLAACESGQGSSHQPFSGIAQHLMRHSQLPAIVAMQFAIHDTAATAFMRGFYGALAQGIPVDAAMADGRLAILTERNVNQPDWAAPLLLMRTLDGKLWERPPIKLPCPYPGMVPFSEAESPHFYGRERETEELLATLRLHSLITVIGPSGCGKSSLVFAGLIPALRKSGLFGAGKWLVHSMRPGSHPMDRLKSLLPPSLTLPPTVGEGNIAKGEKLLLVIDQFEELFTMAEEEESRAFLDKLMALVALPDVYIVLTVRADFLAELMRSSIWRAIQASRLEVLSLEAEGVRKAIVQPAHDIGGEVDPVLVERLVRDSAGEPGPLPLLQETLVLLWERQEGGYLSVRAYDALGEGKLNGMQIALARHADAALALLTADQQAIAQRIFVRLVQFGIKREPIRRQQPASLLLSVGDDPSAFEHTLQHLAKRRLLTLSAAAEDSERQVDLAHEALISGWPRLQGWLTTWQQIEQTRRNLEEKAQEWIRLERAGGYLDAAELAEADTWLAQPLVTEVGYSQHLVDLIATSRKVIYPGWHRAGSAGLAIGGLSIAALIGWLYFYLQTTTHLPFSVQITAWLFVFTLLALITVVIVISRRSDSFLFQRFSHRIATYRTGYGMIGVLMVLTLGLWATQGREMIDIANKCNALGYTKNKSINIAIINKNVESSGAKVFSEELNKKSKYIYAKVLTREEAKLCNSFLTHKLTLTGQIFQKTDEVSYNATIESISSPDNIPSVSSPGEDQCSLFGFLATLVIEELEGTSDIISFAKLPFPKTCQAYLANEKGFALLHEKKYKDAKAYFEIALNQVDPMKCTSGYATAHANLGDVYIKEGNAQAAIKKYECAVSKAPEYPRFLINLAYACYQMKRYECAEQHNKTAYKIEPNNFSAYNNLAIVYRAQKKYELSEEMLEYAEKVLPDADEERHKHISYKQVLMKNKGILEFNRKRFVEARTLLEGALKLPKSDISEEITYYLALLDEQEKPNKQACKRWLDYKEITPSALLDEKERRKKATQQIDRLNCLSESN